MSVYAMTLLVLGFPNVLAEIADVRRDDANSPGTQAQTLSRVR